MQQLVFLRRQVDFLAARRHPMRIVFDQQVGEYDVVACGFFVRQVGGRRRAPQNRLDAINDLARAERLHYVIVRAGLKALHAVGFFPFGGQHDDRGRLVLPQFLAHFHPVHSGKHDVEQYQVVVLAERHVQRRFPVFRLVDDITFLFQIHAQQPADAFLVIHHENALRRRLDLSLRHVHFTCPLSYSGIRMHAGHQQIDADQRKQHDQKTDDRQPGRPFADPPPRKTQVQIRAVVQPGDQRPHFLRIPSPEPGPGDLRPDHREDERAERKDRKTDGDRTIADLVEIVRIELGKPRLDRRTERLAQQEPDQTVQHQSGEHRPDHRVQLATGIDALHPARRLEQRPVDAEKRIHVHDCRVMRSEDDRLHVLYHGVHRLAIGDVRHFKLRLVSRRAERKHADDETGDDQDEQQGRFHTPSFPNGSFGRAGEIDRTDQLHDGGGESDREKRFAGRGQRDMDVQPNALQRGDQRLRVPRKHRGVSEHEHRERHREHAEHRRTVNGVDD